MFLRGISKSLWRMEPLPSTVPSTNLCGFRLLVTSRKKVERGGRRPRSPRRRARAGRQAPARTAAVLRPARRGRPRESRAVCRNRVARGEQRLSLRFWRRRSTRDARRCDRKPPLSSLSACAIPGLNHGGRLSFQRASRVREPRETERLGGRVRQTRDFLAASLFERLWQSSPLLAIRHHLMWLVHD